MLGTCIGCALQLGTRLSSLIIFCELHRRSWQMRRSERQPQRLRRKVRGSWQLSESFCWLHCRRPAMVTSLMMR